MITKSQKLERAESLKAKFEGASGVYIVGFEYMNTTTTLAFRRALKDKGLYYKVIKNSGLRKILESMGGYEAIPAEKLKGQSGVILSYNDPIAPAKVVKEFFDKGEKPKLKACMIEGQYYNGDDLKLIASLPTREDMIAAIVGSLHAPISGIVGSINAVMRDLSSVIEEVAKKQNAA